MNDLVLWLRLTILNTMIHTAHKELLIVLDNRLVHVAKVFIFIFKHITRDIIMDTEIYFKSNKIR